MVITITYVITSDCGSNSATIAFSGILLSWSPPLVSQLTFSYLFAAIINSSAALGLPFTASPYFS